MFLFISELRVEVLPTHVQPVHLTQYYVSLEFFSRIRYMKIYYRLIRFGIPKQLPNEPLSSNSGSSINAAAYEEMNSVGSNGLLSFTIPNILFKYYELPKPIRAAFQRYVY